MPKKDPKLDDAPTWYRDAVIYEVHVRAFADANGDGIGDFRGLTAKLDYLDGLGVTALWLLPFYPSPLKDDGYDIADYGGIHPHYGTLRDFRAFLREAHRRGIRVITELVLNHTSDQHAWFQRARRAKAGSPARAFYVWSDTPHRYADARIIFKDFETSNWAWDPVAKAYYWHRFYSHQPDLNYDNPEVRKAMLRVVDYWLGLGVDGLRLDAVPYLFEREGTNCENLPATHGFLKMLRAHVDAKFEHRMLIAEANQWPEDAVRYCGNGDECHMAFHFPLMPRIFMSVQMEDRFPIVDILDQTPSLPETAQWALFLRNHDELTLEMVTDEERDYMYRMYARDPASRINLGIRRRLAPLMEHDRRKIELMNALLLSLPGTPVLYYGDEIGMGDNYYLGDRNGVRTPMQWSADRNAGFSTANPQRLYLPIIIDPEYHYEAINVENQERNQASLLWWMKRMIAIRKSSKAFGRGRLELLFPDNPKVLAFIRRHHDEQVLVVVNLSRYSQMVELDLARHAGCVPEEIFSRTPFAIIRDTPYVLTLGGYGFYLFALKAVPHVPGVREERAIPDLGLVESWDDLFRGKTRLRLEREVLPDYLRGCRWFGGASKTMQQLRVVERVAVGREPNEACFALLEAQYTDGPPELYGVPLAFGAGDEIRTVTDQHAHGVIARLKVRGRDGILYDAVYGERFRRDVLALVEQRHRLKGAHGDVTTTAGPTLRALFRTQGERGGLAQVLETAPRHTVIVYASTLALKLYRRLDEGISPEIEIARFLTEERSYPQTPPFAGAIEYRRPGADPISLGWLQGFVTSQGDAWRFTVDEVVRYLGRVLSRARDFPALAPPAGSPLAQAYQEMPPLLQELIGGVYLELVAVLGRRTAELHHALSSSDQAAFAPEPFTALYQRSVFQSMQTLARRVLHALKKAQRQLPDRARDIATRLLAREDEMVARLRAVLTTKLTAVRIRIHGDYHLGRVLYTGNDFIVLDFEGDPTKPFSERRLKRSPLRDVADMLRSFQDVSSAALAQHTSLRPEDLPLLEPWADRWHRDVGAAFLRAYCEAAGHAAFLPKDWEETDTLLNAFLLTKAIADVGTALTTRPERVTSALRAIVQVLDIKGSAPLAVEIQNAYPSGVPNP